MLDPKTRTALGNAAGQGPGGAAVQGREHGVADASRGHLIKPMAACRLPVCLSVGSMPVRMPRASHFAESQAPRQAPPARTQKRAPAQGSRQRLLRRCRQRVVRVTTVPLRLCWCSPRPRAEAPSFPRRASRGILWAELPCCHGPCCTWQASDAATGAPPLAFRRRPWQRPCLSGRVIASSPKPTTGWGLPGWGTCLPRAW